MKINLKILGLIFFIGICGSSLAMDVEKLNFRFNTPVNWDINKRFDLTLTPEIKLKDPFGPGSEWDEFSSELDLEYRALKYLRFGTYGKWILANDKDGSTQHLNLGMYAKLQHRVGWVKMRYKFDARWEENTWLDTKEFERSYNNEIKLNIHPKKVAWKPYLSSELRYLKTEFEGDDWNRWRNALGLSWKWNSLLESDFSLNYDRKYWRGEMKSSWFVELSQEFHF